MLLIRKEPICERIVVFVKEDMILYTVKTIFVSKILLLSSAKITMSKIKNDTNVTYPIIFKF
jgi:hypothetical protein